MSLSRRQKVTAPALVMLIVLLLGCHSTPPTSGTKTVPATPSPPPGMFHDVAARVGLNFRWGHSDLTHINILDSIGHGCAFLDYDGDGRLDILLVGDTGARLFHHRSDGTFEDVTQNALPPPPPNAHFLGCTVADYDGDGHPDIFLTGYGCTALYHNEGNGTFRDATLGSGLEARGPYDWTTSAAWADVDGDGRLDLFVCRYVQFTPKSKQLCAFKGLDGTTLQMACNPTVYPAERGSLYKNVGDGHFRDITRQAGFGDLHGNNLGCMFCDYNNDGKPDLFVASDLQNGDLYLNLGNGRFRNVGSEAGVALGADGAVASGMGIDWGDYDNDGRFDLLVTNYAGQPKSLFHNEGKGLFTNTSYPSGIGAASLLPLAFGGIFADLENEGLLDIVFTNGHVESQVEKVDSSTAYAQSSLLFHNQGGGRFNDISLQAGADFQSKIVGRGVAVGDFDGDGRLDLLMVDDEGAPLLLHNDSPSDNHWLELRCLWRSPHTEAVGARITLISGGRKQIREVRASGSYLSANAPTVHFGLGKSATVDALKIRWPDGSLSNFHTLTPDHLYEVTPQGYQSLP